MQLFMFNEAIMLDFYTRVLGLKLRSGPWRITHPILFSSANALLASSIGDGAGAKYRRI